MLEKIKQQSELALRELLKVAKLEKNDILVIGCSTSEVLGKNIGSHGSLDVAQAVFEGIYAQIKEKEIFLAVQCCEHLNRALLVEKEITKLYPTEIVNAVPCINAGGAFATTVYNKFKNPVLVENIIANAGMDIGGTLIGMHLKKVAVPVKISISKIGEANLVVARTRPKFIGGERAIYNQQII